MLATRLFEELDQLNTGFNLFSNEFWNSTFHGGDYPLTNVVEEGNQFKVYMLLPGVDLNDLNIDYANGLLTLSGERKSDIDKGDKVISRERSFGTFHKKLKVRVSVDAEKIKAKYINGVLEIILKKAEKIKPKKIKVN